MCFFLSFEIITQFLLCFKAEKSRPILYMYQGTLVIYACLLLLVTGLFGVRFIFMSRKLETAGGISVQREASKRNLNRLVLLTAFALCLEIMVLLIRIFLDPRASQARFYGPRFFLMFLDGFVVLIILFTFFSMMRSRIHFLAEYDMDDEHHGRTRSELSEPLMAPSESDASQQSGVDDDETF